MADAIVVQVADAIVAQLLASSLIDEGCEPRRSWADWSEDVVENDRLHVDVVPADWQCELETRGHVQWTDAVDIGIRRKFDAQELDITTGRVIRAEVDRLAKLVEDVAEFFMSDRLTSVPEASWMQTRVKLPYSREMLRAKMFLGIVTVSFRYQRTLP